MASLSDLEQQMAAAIRRQTPSAAAAAVLAGARGGAPDRAAAAAAIRRRMAAQRARAEGAESAALASARSLADQTSRQREQLKGLKDELQDLQSQLSEALTLQLSRESKCRLATESISVATATTERLRTSVADLRDERDKRAAIIAEQLQDLESLEAKSNEDAEAEEKVQEALSWYKKFLGFWVVPGEGGVKFVFNKIDPQHPEKEYSFRISQRLESVIECDPYVKDIEELAKDLDLSEHLFKFVRMAREKFQSTSMNGTLPVSPVVSSGTLPVSPVVSGTLPVSPVVGPDVSAAPLPSPMVMSVNSKSEDAQNQTQSISKNNVQLLPAKRGATAQSGASPGVLRRSPRVKPNP